MVKPQSKKPLKIRISDKEAFLIFTNGVKFDLSKGIVLSESSSHYGFSLIFDTKDGYSVENCYNTQCPISTITFSEGVLRIHEHNKVPLAWHFKPDGTLTQTAYYYENWRPTREFIADHADEILKETKCELTDMDYDKQINTLIKLANSCNDNKPYLATAYPPIKTSKKTSKKKSKSISKTKSDGGRV